MVWLKCQVSSTSNSAHAGLSILKPSIKQVGVANGKVSVVKYVTHLPFPQLSHKASMADIFVDFPNSIMSVGKTADDDTVSVFTKYDVKVYYEEGVLITCKNKPILIGVRKSCGRYRIPLQQRQGRW